MKVAKVRGNYKYSKIYGTLLTVGSVANSYLDITYMHHYN